jgi:malonyl-CoA O-methyltransferase
VAEEPLIELDKQQARRAFEKAADSYDEAAVLQQEIGRRLIERLDVIRCDPGRILDLGAGTGACTRPLMQRYPSADIIALDVAHAMLRKTQARTGDTRQLTCVCADGERLPFADDSFDFIFSNLMLQWCTELEPVFTELQRVLMPGGLLLFTSFGPDTLMELRASWSDVDGYTHVNSFIDMHNVGDALVTTRWAEPVIDAERITVTYREVGTLMQDLKHIGAHNVTRHRPRGLTGRQRMNKMIKSYERFREDGVLPASYEVVYGHAWAPDEKNPAAAIPEVGLDGLQGH